MSQFATRTLPHAPDVTAPDGSAVRLLLSLKGGSMAHFELPAGAVSKAVVHRTVEEIWYVVGGGGEMWREQAGHAETVALAPGGNHLMLMGVKEPLVAGDTVALTLTFETSPPLELTATVGQPAVAESGQAAAPAAD